MCVFLILTPQGRALEGLISYPMPNLRDYFSLICVNSKNACVNLTWHERAVPFGSFYNKI